MKIKITASLFALTAFALSAQPTLPTTNSFIVPIANPYSASWIYYTTNADSGLNFLNGASIPFVMALSNNIVTSISTATNGLVGASITNGLATISYVNAATNGLVTSAVTNGLATTNFVTSQGYVTASVTNGLATTAYVNAATNGFVTSSVTNGLATTNYVNTTALSAGPGGNTDGQVITNLQNLTWGTATAKPAGAGAPATVYYYFTNGQPMFGIISTNN